MESFVESLGDAPKEYADDANILPSSSLNQLEFSKSSKEDQ